jgi:hypothetical protein
MKYFFLAEGWQIKRVWQAGQLWNELAWRRKPYIESMGKYLIDNAEEMVLFKVEDAVGMIEVVLPPSHQSTPADRPGQNDQAAIAPVHQVRITRLVSAEQVLERITPIDKYDL